MTNEQKYKTAEERIKAFHEWCNKQTCVQKDKCTSVRCAYNWLSFEAEEKKPEPCPFCGAETYLIKDSNQYLVRCRNRCCYRGKSFIEKDEAIASHNRVARAVMDVKLAHEIMNKIENSTIGFCNYEKETIKSILKRYREASYAIGAAKESEVK